MADMESLFDRVRQEFTVTKIYYFLTGREAQAGKFAPCPICDSSRFEVGDEDTGWTCWAGDCHEVSGRDALGLSASFWKVDRTTAARRLLDKLGRLVDSSTESFSRSLKTIETKVKPAPISDSPEYQAWLSEIVDKAQAELWTKASEPGRLGRIYLHRQRFLSIETMKAYGLGVVTKQHKATINGKFVFCDKGILIPWTRPGGYAGGQVRSLPGYYQITDYKTGEPQKYKMVSGSRRGEYLYPGPLCGWDHTWSYRGPLLVTEGEFDCMVAQQALGGLCAVKTLGSATAGPVGLDGDERAQLADITKILIAADDDEAGQKCREAWRRYSRRAVSLTLPSGKDLSEAAAAGVDLRAWFLGELDRLNVSKSLEPGCYDYHEEVAQ